MGRDNWYRNETWNSEIEAAFYTKLNRARDKRQYLRIQACTLADIEPKVALRLLDEYFKLEVNIDRSQAYADQATAYETLGEIDKAIESYEAALHREKEFPNSVSTANLSLPFLVATKKVASHYERCLQILSQNPVEHFIFPMQFFMWYASKALILSELGKKEEGQEHAIHALKEAAKTHTGLRYHPALGLVGERYVDVRKELVEISMGKDK